jgi:hypothetical protein
MDLENKDYTLAINELNQSITRWTLLQQKMFDGKRDLYEVLGYFTNPVFSDYYTMYERNPIAKRIIEAYPNACWSKMPEIIDDEDIDNQTEFEKAVTDLFKKYNIKNYLRRADILQRLGEYSVLLIGSNNLSQNLTKLKQFYYIMPYSQENAVVDIYEENINSDRFGMPSVYKINVGTVNKRQIQINHTHIIHISENALENDFIGCSVLKCILNTLTDLDKVMGSSSESFWLNARGGLHINAENPMNSKEDGKVLKDITESYLHKLSRVIATQNTSVTPINYNIADPKNNFDILISAISGATGIPSAILTGNEVGVRASSQDVNNWYARVEERQENFCESGILRPFIDKMIALGVLPAPINNEYTVNWQPLQTPDQEQKAKVALLKMQAINAYVNGAADTVITPQQVTEMLEIDYREDEVAEKLEQESQDIAQEQGQ